MGFETVGNEFQDPIEVAFPRMHASHLLTTDRGV